ncbi:hypothetical protein BVER_01121 [Candidatus Burkholderia verschuerenii]|uniref:LysM domain-containing protein n=2 Tax=Candidatus Burkholderia verschuerenii TaxID=242163 RepID=A0A0L0MA50_9BURK|nr:hypothetical protein BVER_01121 [Candidatus Burkholderia verschuerenii]
MSLDWKLIKAMIWVETGADSPEWRSKPMQIGVPGDPGLSSLLSGHEGGDLIISPGWTGRLTPVTIRTIPAYNIRAGVGYLLTRMADFEYRSTVDARSVEYDVTVKLGDSLERIAKDQKSTVDILKRLNPSIGHLRSGQTIRCRKGAIRKVITGWRHISTDSIARRYNGGGDPYYAQKLDYALSLIRAESHR